MRYKRKKHKDKLFILISLILTIALYIIVNNIPDKQHTVTIQDDTDYKVFTYLITDIDDTGYYGKSEDGKIGIYFTSDNIDKDELNNINEGSKILTYFEKENHIDGLIKVEVVE